MSWKIIDTDEYQIKETVALLELKNYFKNYDTKCPVIVQHGDKKFWFNTTQTYYDRFGCYGETGPTGATGCVGNTGSIGSRCYMDENDREYKRSFRPTLDERFTEIMIQFQTTPELIDQFTGFQFTLSSNKNGETYKAFIVHDCVEDIRCTYGIYKGEHFNTIYNSMLISNPLLTEEELFKMSDRNNLNLVEHKPYCGEEGCFQTYAKHTKINTGKLSVTFRILLCDLENNMGAIKNLFKYQR